MIQRKSSEQAPVDAHRGQRLRPRFKRPNHCGSPNQDRQDFAWHLVLTGMDDTEEAVVRMANISAKQVYIMRKARKQLGASAAEYRSWRGARQAAQALQAAAQGAAQEGR